MHELDGDPSAGFSFLGWLQAIAMIAVLVSLMVVALFEPDQAGHAGADGAGQG